MSTTAISKELAPQRLKMSYKEYLEFAGESQIVEWVNGEVISYMPPTDKHQKLVLFLSTVLNSSRSFSFLIQEYFELPRLR